ncbi:sensor histidine kinase [Algoriphagus confluentis]|uniref:Signal transduction histidine kinase internal region domain-containing protein n=1 Tax=Algoriphagus confluentis TaxID=1697556 RepID=A0ABQ6PPH9_9BACT|nr:hypothetical protein Aconfl_17360 [Algoriphagus confluentis]
MRLKEKTIRWIGIPIVAFVSSYFIEGHDLAYSSPLHAYLVSLIYTAVYWNGAVFIFFKLRKVFPHIPQTGKRLILTLLSLTLFISISSVIMKSLLEPNFQQEILSWKDYFQSMPFSFVISLIIGTFYEASYYFQNWKQSFVQNQQLKSEHLRSQFEVLQNQMSPHFLFNSLNTLTTLIAENQEMAIEFTQNLSEVYRYILKQKDRELVSLQEELDFAQSYLSLLEIRYPNSLTVKVEIDEKSKSYFIPPLTLQMLIENAIKHNSLSKMKPLLLEIYSQSSGTLVIKNNLQPKKTLERSTQTGLENIRKRYELLGCDPIDIIQTAHNFMVAVPIIEIKEERESIPSILTA